MYIYENNDWTAFHWDSDRITPLLSEARFLQGSLLGRIKDLGFSIDSKIELDALSEEVIASSQIEGVILDSEKVRSSVAKHLGLDAYDPSMDTESVDGAVSTMLDATQHYLEPLTANRLFGWHAALFHTGFSGLRKITVASFRAGSMSVVSGAIGREKVHYSAPEADRVPVMMNDFIQWFNHENMDPLIKAAIAHLWFLSIHPFEDGNGRIARTLTEMLLARSDNSPRRYYSMAGYILEHREDYYENIERAQKGTSDITQWLTWFLQAFSQAVIASEKVVSNTLLRDSWWRSVDGISLNDRQRSVLQRLLGDFKGKLTTSKWAKLCKVSNDTALRDINDLIKKGILVKDDIASGRSTSYHLKSSPLENAISFIDSIPIQNEFSDMPDDEIRKRRLDYLNSKTNP